ncbi:MAG TPA: zinc ribbon domain-containing protein [Dehalococcoidia bacterium]|nr:zinc ribbon domain-containing protein [Dehalococcoidia bacterium]
MPIYEYECTKCGERFELRRSMSDSNREAKCPACGAEDSHRIFSPFFTISGNSCTPSGPT